MPLLALSKKRAEIGHGNLDFDHLIQYGWPTVALTVFCLVLWRVARAIGKWTADIATPKLSSIVDKHMLLIDTLMSESRIQTQVLSSVVEALQRIERHTQRTCTALERLDCPYIEKPKKDEQTKDET